MALKLGELLLQEKIITVAQLDEALRSQVIYGIKLGSSLVEMGYVDEDALAQLLSSKLGVPCVGKNELAAVPKELIQDFPRTLAEAHHVVPFRQEGNRLSLAMADPTDFKALDEIAFATGKVIQPYIAPDVEISRALAKYYRLSMGHLRYEMIADKRRKKEAAKPPEPATITIPTITESGELLNVTIPAEFQGFWQQEGEVPDDRYQMPDDVSRYTVDRVSMDFAGARSRDEVANVFISYLGQEFTAGALFIVRGNSAIGWRGVNGGERIPQFTELQLLLSKPSVLRQVVESKTHYLGELAGTFENQLLLKALKLPLETELLALPVVMLQKVVAIVLVTADSDSLGRRLTELQKLVRKASLAFEMLIIRNKILMT
jgi:hypothetical protein